MAFQVAVLGFRNRLSFSSQQRLCRLDAKKEKVSTNGVGFRKKV